MKSSKGQSGNPGGRPKVLSEVLRFLKPHVRAAGTNFPTSGSSSQKSRLIEPLVNTKNCYISKAQNLRPRPIFHCQKDCQPFASIAAAERGILFLRCRVCQGPRFSKGLRKGWEPRRRNIGAKAWAASQPADRSGLISMR